VSELLRAPLTATYFFGASDASVCLGPISYYFVVALLLWCQCTV